jgi:hypothetical protein
MSKGRDIRDWCRRIEKLAYGRTATELLRELNEDDYDDEEASQDESQLQDDERDEALDRLRELQVSLESLKQESANRRVKASEVDRLANAAQEAIEEQNEEEAKQLIGALQRLVESAEVIPENWEEEAERLLLPDVEKQLNELTQMAEDRRVDRSEFEALAKKVSLAIEEKETDDALRLIAELRKLVMNAEVVPENWEDEANELLVAEARQLAKQQDEPPGCSEEESKVLSELRQEIIAALKNDLPAVPSLVLAWHKQIEQTQEAIKRRNTVEKWEKSTCRIRRSDGALALMMDRVKPWKEMPSEFAGDLALGDIVMLGLNSDDDIIEIKKTGESDPSAIPKEIKPPSHEDHSSKIKLSAVTIKPIGSRATAHHSWQITCEALRSYRGAVQKTSSETPQRDGWVYGIPFGHTEKHLKQGSILFNYSEKDKTIFVFHSFDQPSG